MFGDTLWQDQDISFIHEKGMVWHKEKKTANKLEQGHLDCWGMKSNSDNIQEVSLLAIAEEIDEVYED